MALPWVKLRRHGQRRLAQHVVDQPQAFAKAEPDAAWPMLPGANFLRREVWIEQPHGSVEMHEAGTMLDHLPLQLAHDPAQLGSLPAQSVYDVWLDHRNSPSRNISVQDGNRTTPPLGTRAWWQLLHDAGLLTLPVVKPYAVRGGSGTQGLCMRFRVGLARGSSAIQPGA